MCCLGKGCEASRCKLGGCTICGQKHNSWLCTQSPRLPIAAQAPHVVACVSKNADKTNDPAQSTLLATALVVISDKNGKPITFRALCDPGSQVNLIASSAYQKLRFGRTAQPVDLLGIDGQKSIGLGKVCLEFKSRFSSANSYQMNAIILKKITSRLPAESLETSEYKHIEGLNLADPEYNITGDIDILLGAAVCSELLKSGVRRGEAGQPIAQRTRIGWISYGNTQVSQDKLSVLHAAMQKRQNQSTKTVRSMNYCNAFGRLNLCRRSIFEQKKNSYAKIISCQTLCEMRMADMSSNCRFVLIHPSSVIRDKQRCVDYIN